jgi:hypothetical protein
MGNAAHINHPTSVARQERKRKGKEEKALLYIEGTVARCDLTFGAETQRIK